MKARMTLIAAALVCLSAPANAQMPCSCATAARSHSVIRPASAELWEDYGKHPDCGGCGTCRRCCDPCCTPLVCVIPNTLRKIGRTLDCLLPCGPRSGHGCGLSCIGAGSGCMPGYCGRPGILCFNKCADCGGGEMVRGEVLTQPLREQPAHVPPQPPPAQESRRMPSQVHSRTARATPPPATEEHAQEQEASRPVGSGVNHADHMAPVRKQPSSVLKRTSYEEEVEEEEPPPAPIRWPRNMSVIPHNPLR